MKIRNGFVSNSSSSSFIIALSAYPITTKELKTLLFKERKYFYLDTFFDTLYTTKDIMPFIEQEIKNNLLLKEKDMIKNLSEGWFNYPDMRIGRPDESPYSMPENYYSLDFNSKEAIEMRKDRDNICNNYRKERKEYAKKVFEHFKNKTKGQKLFLLSFGNENGGVFAALEYNNTFKNIPHIIINHH